MKDTIYRQDAIDALEEERLPIDSDYAEGFMSGLNKAIWVIEKWVPSAQLDLSSYSDKLWRNAYERGRAEAEAEIIRCKNCKWFYEDKWCVKYMYALLPEDFCSRAERREDG